MDNLAFFVFAVLFEALAGCDGQIAVLQLQIDLILLEARKVNFQLVVIIVILQIRLHHTSCVLAIQLVVHIGFKASVREAEPVIKQTLSKNTR